MVANIRIVSGTADQIATQLKHIRILHTGLVGDARKWKVGKYSHGSGLSTPPEIGEEHDGSINVGSWKSNIMVTACAAARSTRIVVVHSESTIEDGDSALRDLFPSTTINAISEAGEFQVMLLVGTINTRSFTSSVPLYFALHRHWLRKV
jgi:hypothetical protein